MKKLLTLVVSASMLLSVAAASFAAEDFEVKGKVYGEYMGLGKDSFKLNDVAQWGTDNKDQSQDILLGGKVVLMEKFVVSGEGHLGSLLTKEDEQKTTLFKVGGGYRVYEDEQIQLDVLGSYLQMSEKMGKDGTELAKTDAFLLSADLAYWIADDMSIEAGVGYTPFAKVSVNGAEVKEDAPHVLTYNAKFNYYLIENFGVSIGYNNTQFTGGKDGNKVEHNLNGFTFGASYKF